MLLHDRRRAARNLKRELDGVWSPICWAGRLPVSMRATGRVPHVVAGPTAWVTLARTEISTRSCISQVRLNHKRAKE